MSEIIIDVGCWGVFAVTHLNCDYYRSCPKRSCSLELHQLAVTNNPGGKRPACGTPRAHHGHPGYSHGSIAL